MSEFTDRIESLAKEAEIKVADTTSHTAQLKFSFDDDGKHTSQIVWIKDYDGTWEFSCLSFLKKSDAEDFPKFVLLYALRENATHKLGFWCIEGMNSGNLYLEYMDNHDQSLLTANQFRRICWNTAKQVDKFERMVMAEA